MPQAPKYVLDAQSKKGLRITAFSDIITDLAADFKEWAEEMEMTHKDLWYADIFDYKTRERVAVLTMDDKDYTFIERPPEGKAPKMFKRNRLIARLAGELR